ncbi:MAG: DUF4301 family protein [Bacteroidales bacterium]|nr:DUF4301 family protein [Bacteroidales bacterium]MBR6246944.1 DUF4301 family protein [Bacteroidales bacterium]
MFSNEDIRQIESRGSSPKTVQAQVERFKKGFPWMKIVGPATPGHGIAVLTKEQEDAAVAYCDKAKVAGKCKFVPASGAASRMFKDIFAGLAKMEAGEEGNPSVEKLAQHIKDFAFYTPELFGEPQDTLEYRRDVAQKVLTDKGLAYGSKPKGVILFHRYADEVRTAFAEHLVEAQEYMRNADGTTNLVVTISPEHRPLFEAALAAVKDEYEKRYGIKYTVEFTYQDKATDTVAVDEKNKPFRTDEGKLLFRPAGHGALIYNLGKVEQEIVSIKNIDNVANERLLPLTARYKKVLMGKCLELRDKIFSYLDQLDAQKDPASAECRHLCDKIEAFFDKELCIQLPLTPDQKERFLMLHQKLNRPIRVCGMVKNEGEPGGGPFIVAGKDGSSNLQILESVQINQDEPHCAEMLSRATHFNPVDLVCCLRNYRGEKFDLLQYVDEDAGFISSKSYQGRELKALELPGLWNGAMSDWNTLFVEVPLGTFNPVKVLLDLLRPAHQ